MMPQPQAPKVARGRAVEWTDADLDRLAEIHVEEDTALMLAFVRQYGSARLVAVVTAQPEADGDATADAVGE